MNEEKKKTRNDDVTAGKCIDRYRNKQKKNVLSIQAKRFTRTVPVDQTFGIFYVSSVSKKKKYLIFHVFFCFPSYLRR